MAKKKSTKKGTGTTPVKGMKKAGLDKQKGFWGGKKAKGKGAKK